jgi:hypothetical protein
MWIRTAISLSVAEILEASFGAFAQATHRTEVLHQLLTESLQLIWAAACGLALRSIRADSQDKSSSRWTGPARLLTTIFTCLPPCYRTVPATGPTFSRSTDGGLTFSAPRRINDDPINQNKWHWFGTLAVAPNGRIDSVWLDTRNAANNTDSQLFYSFSTDGGVTWSPNVAVSNAFNPFEGYPVQNKIGDYITIVSDNTGGNVAYSATFNFNPSRGQHEEDVYYVRVAPPTSVRTLLSAASRLTHAGAGTFDIAMPLTGTSGVEDRTSNTYNAVFTFDGPVTSGQVTVLSGTATVGTILFSGNTMTAQLTGVTSAEVVTLRVQNINGDGQPHGDVPFGFLTADVNANRIVDRPDVQQVKADRGQPVTPANFRDDINLSGIVDRPDVDSVRANRGHSIP